MKMQKLGVLGVSLTAAAATMLLGAGAASASTASATAADTTTTVCAPPIPFHERVCLTLVTDHLFVESATVHNIGEPTGYGWVENLGDQAKHRSPNRLAQGQSWTYPFNRSVANGDRICGWIGSNPSEQACATVSD